MNRLALFCLLINVSGVFMTHVRTGIPRSCLEIKKKVPRAWSGRYNILVGANTLITVYCEMAKYGGGFTFIPREAVRKGMYPTLINQIYKDRTKVLLRFQKHSGLQPFTLITQLPYFASHKLGVLMHKSAGYTTPRNSGLGDYIFLGIIPAYRAKYKTIQGFRSNGRYIQFRNCDANPNSYFAFFPNHRKNSISNYHRSNLVNEKHGVAVNWRKTGVASYFDHRLPNNFLFLTELHFGGCGAYTSSDRWRDASRSGTAIGLR